MIQKPNTPPNAPRPDQARISPAAESDRFTLILELLRVVAVSLTAVLTAWCGYQSTRWNGIMATEFSRANALRIQSASLMNATYQVLQVDLSLFEEWLSASADGDTQRVAYYERIFTDTFRVAFRAWLAAWNQDKDSAPLTPFDMPEYISYSGEQATQLSAQAGAHFDEGAQANQIGDNYTLNTVILALSLFLSGIADRFTRRIPHMALLLMAYLIVLVAIVTLLSYPIA